MGAAGSSFHLHSSLWDRGGTQAALRRRQRRDRQAPPLFGQWLAGQMAMARELAYFYAPGVNSYKRYQSGSFAPTRVAARLGQPHLRLPPLRRGRRLPRGEPHPRRRRQPVPGLRGDHRGGPARRRAASSRRPSSTRATPTRTPRCPRCPRRCARRSASSSAPRSRARRSATAWSSTICTRLGSSSKPSTSRDRLGADAALRADLRIRTREATATTEQTAVDRLSMTRLRSRSSPERRHGHGARGRGAVRRGGRADRRCRHRRQGRAGDGGAGREGRRRRRWR